MAISGPRPIVDATWSEVLEFGAGPDDLADGEWVEEEEYLTLDLGQALTESEIARCADFQLAYLNSSTPYLSIAGKVFQGKHEGLIGTELVMRRSDSEGQATDVKPVFAPIASTSSRIFFQPVTLKQRSSRTRQRGSEAAPGGPGEDDDDDDKVGSASDAGSLDGDDRDDADDDDDDDDDEDGVDVKRKSYQWVNQDAGKGVVKRGPGRPRGSKSKSDRPATETERRPRGRPRGSRNRNPGRPRRGRGGRADAAVAAPSGSTVRFADAEVEEFGSSETPMAWEPQDGDPADGPPDGDDAAT